MVASVSHNSQEAMVLCPEMSLSVPVVTVQTDARVTVPVAGVALESSVCRFSLLTCNITYTHTYVYIIYVCLYIFFIL